MTNWELEAAAQVFWNEDKQEYFIHCPEQEVSVLQLSSRDPELEAEHLLILDIHSHTQWVLFSATDNSDEKETRLFESLVRLQTQRPNTNSERCVEEKLLILGFGCFPESI